MPQPLAIGKHTVAMAQVIDQSIDLFFKGHSSFWDVEVPFRHGKSDLFSRALPGYFLGRCYSRNIDPDIIMTGYGASLVQGFSLDARERIIDPKYRALFPDVEVADTRNSAEEWRLKRHTGKVVATGLGGSLTGKGYHLGICDDTVKSREEAESPTYREKTFTAFTNDFMSRRAPTAITFLVQTPWHVDGVQGRLEKNSKQDPDFPHFKRIVFPARKKRDDGTWEYLFPERFDDAWYISQYATLQTYGAAGPLDCNPIPAEGNVCKPEWFSVVNAVPQHVSAVRAWDMAGTEKKLADFTSGCLMVEGTDGIYYIVDYRRGQIAAPRVPSFIQSTAFTDSKHTEIVIEEEPAASGKIAASYILGLLTGFPAWTIHPTGDKLTRALPLFAMAEVGRVKLVAGEWNRVFWDEVRAFPSGEHDDMIDAAAHAFNHIATASRAGGF